MTVIDTYTLQIVRDEGTVPQPWSAGHVSGAIDEVAENLSLMLPDGYRAVIRRWDEEDNPHA